MKDIYKSIRTVTPELTYKDQGSKFYARAFPITNEKQAQIFLEETRKNHKKANHHCYAWKLGNTDDIYRANDDGEPTHSAGDPILGQIIAHDLSDVLVVVSRFFGGTKLGISGLIKSYREAAKMVLNEALIIEKQVTREILLNFNYPQLSAVMRVIKEQELTIIEQKLQAACEITLDVKVNDLRKTTAIFETIYPVKVCLK